MERKFIIRSIAVFASLFLLTACIPHAMKKATTADDLAPGKTVVVMKVELVPPLGKHEQHFKWNDVGSKEFKDAVWFLTGDEYRRFETEPGIRDYKNRMILKLGETGYTVADNQPFFALTGMISLQFQPTMQRLSLPAGFKVDIRKGDQAVYLGTIRYHRDEFSEITKIEVVDEYGKELKAFRKKFGSHAKLKKRLLSSK